MSILTNTENVRAVPKLTRITEELHTIFKRGTDDVVQVGRLLMSAKEEVGHGEFSPWLEKEFSLSEKSAQRYMAAHKFIINVLTPLLKNDKLSDLRLHRSALYDLIEMHSHGEARDDNGNTYPVTQGDIEAVLQEALEDWVGPKRLIEIIKSRHPVEPTIETTEEAEPEVVGEAAGEIIEGSTGEAADADTAPDAAGDGEDDPSNEPLPESAPMPKSAPSAKDKKALSGFDDSILNLKRLAGGSPEKYAATTMQIADLEAVKDLLGAVIDLKNKQRVGTDGISAEASAQDRTAYYEQTEAA